MPRSFATASNYPLQFPRLTPASERRRYPDRVRKAVIDVGSGSILLLVAEKSESGWHAVSERSKVTLLGDGVRQSGTLLAHRQAETLAVLADFWATAEAAGATTIFAGGTAALRIAKNSDEFLAAATLQGTPVTVLSDVQEAELGFLAVADDAAFAESNRITIIDPGGQSTEVVQATRTEGGWVKSFEKSFGIGTLQLRGELLSVETPGPAEIMRASSWIDDTIGTAINPADPGKIVCLGAPGTDLVCVREGWADWRPNEVHGARLDYEEVGKAVGWLMRMTDAERDVVIGVQKGRGTTIHIAALILERMLNSLAAPECFVSIRGWRWAMLNLV